MSKSRQLQPRMLNGTSEPGRQARHIAVFDATALDGPTARVWAGRWPAQTCDHSRSNRSSSITLTQAATKSRTNFSWASSLA